MTSSLFSREPTTPRIFSSGRPVIFEDERGQFQIGGPGYVILHAPRDPASLLNPCTLYIAPTFSDRDPYLSRLPRDYVLTRAIKYNNRTDRIFPAWIGCGMSGFREVAKVKKIVYFYEGHGWLVHPFPRTMPLFERSRWPVGWELRLPSTALIDERGIVHP